jgi:hypothetical protein
MPSQQQTEQIFQVTVRYSAISSAKKLLIGIYPNTFSKFPNQLLSLDCSAQCYIIKLLISNIVFAPISMCSGLIRLAGCA